MSDKRSLAVLWCREDEDFGILCFLDWNGKHWEETRISSEVTFFSYFTVEEAEMICFNRILRVMKIGDELEL